MMLLANLPRLLTIIGIIGVLGYLGWDHWKLDYYESWTHHYEAVQKRNGEAIAAQNRAIRLMWLRQKAMEARAKTAEAEVGKILSATVKEAQVPVRFTKGATCEDDVREVFMKLRGTR